MSDASTAKVQRPPRRWWRRALRWMSVLIVLILLAAGSALWWVWHHQTEVVRHLLAQVPLPVEVHLERFDGNRERLLVTGITLKDKKTGREMLQVPKLTWTPVWKQLRHGQLGILEIDQPAIHLSQAELAPYLAPGPATSSAKPSSSFPLKLSRLTIRQARLQLEGDDQLPALSLRLDHESSDMDLTILTRPRVGAFRVEVRDVEVETSALKLPFVRAAGSFQGAEGLLHVTLMELGPATLEPSAVLLRKLDPWLHAPAAKDDAPPLIQRVVVDRAELQPSRIDSSGMTDWPKAEASLALQLGGIEWTHPDALKLGPQRMELRDLQLRPPTGSGSITIPSMTLAVSSYAYNAFKVSQVELQRPVIEWTADIEKWLMSLRTASSSPGAAVAGSTPTPAVTIEALKVDAATLHLTRTPTLPYEGRTQLSMRGQQLRLDDKGVHSSQPQIVEIMDTTLAEHPADREKPLDALLTAKRGELTLIPDDWFREQRLSRISIDTPRITLLPENTSFLNPAHAANSPVPASAAPAPPLWQKIQIDQLALNNGTVNYSTHLTHRVDVSTALDIRTETYKSVEGHPYQTVTMKNIRITAPELAAAPVTNVEELTATVQWPGLWKTERIESLRMRGGELDVNDVVKQLTGVNPSTNAAGAAPEGKKAAAIPQENGWRINRVAIADTYITLHRLTPGLPPVKFAVNYDVWDMPLQPKHLVGRLEPQKIELSHLSLRSPFDPLREVAIMNTIFIHFTLDGLLAGRIERVEVLNPTLMVGEDLFWYVDYYRKYAAGELPADEPAPRIVSSDDNFAFQAAASMEVAPPSGGGWTLEELAVTGGKLVIAPKGVPLPGIPRPFPFSFVTRLENGQFEAELEIPSDTYTWESLKLEFENLRGHVLFNLPHKQVSNNLTETFHVDKIRYQQLHIENCFLTVTYDAAGIYGQFGGEAYDGYVKGAFNIYNDTSFTWDGWITGTGVRTTEITRKLTPAYLLLDGRVDASVIAQGNTSEVYQTDISFTNTEPGKFSITTLNNAIESIPEDIEGYLQDITRIGIETVRDFDYEKAEAKARFYGREGRGYLRLSGPHGTRNIDVNVYDHRWKVNKKKPTSSTATLNASE